MALVIRGTPIPMEAALQVHSSDWLEVHGLFAKRLTLDQLLPSLGFQQRTGVVPLLRRSVSSQYADGLFPQQPNSQGRVYNLCTATPGRIREVERQLLDAVALLKARLEWLNSGSRLSFGVVYEQRVVMVIDSSASERAELKAFLRVATSVIREQLCHTDSFNIIWCGDGTSQLWEGLRESSSDNLEEAVKWVEQRQPRATPLNTSVVEAVGKALEHANSEAVYLLTHGEASMSAYDQLMEKTAQSLVPLHVVVFESLSLFSLEKYKELATASQGRCHASSPPPRKQKRNPLHSTSQSSISSAGSEALPTSCRPGSREEPPPSLPRGDVLAVWTELETARDTLAEIQALLCEVGGAEWAESEADTAGSDDYLTSLQWLKSHGVTSKKLLFDDFLMSLGFHHCKGRVRIPYAVERNGNIEVVPQSKVIHAQYCKDFIHIRWKDGKIVHVQYKERSYQDYCSKIEGVVSECRQRLDWLKRGSRQLFGTLLEKKIAVIIDTSSSMRDHLDLVRSKFRELLQEQLRDKEQFTVIQLSSEVHSWSDDLVPTSEENLEAASQWVEGLEAGGSTNTLEALSTAMSIREVEAVYLLTDGRPDQPAEQVLAHVQQQQLAGATLPAVHTISFNCGDSAANHFLSQLSSCTGGRYYYVCDDVADPQGPRTYESEDIQQLEDEIAMATEELGKVEKLAESCRKESKGDAKDPQANASVGTKKTKKTAFLSSKKWLEKNNLSALHLTVMDALGPTAIPHCSKRVAVLDKHVSARVFDSVFPFAHVSNDNQVTLINPNGVNLVAYEEKVRGQIDVYWSRLSRLAWSVLPNGQKQVVAEECALHHGEIPSYEEHKELLQKAMEELNWPRKKEDFDLLENEISKAENYIRYSVALREESASRPGSKLRGGATTTSRASSGRSFDRDGHNDSTRLPPSPSTTGGSLAALMDQLQQHTVTPSPLPGVTKRRGASGCLNSSSRGAPAAASWRKPVSDPRGTLKGQKVVARSRNDGFYYPGVVARFTDSRHAVIRFSDGEEEAISVKLVIPVGGAAPCPVLQAGDHVLVRVKTATGPHPCSSSSSRGDGGSGPCYFYVPGTVRVLPENSRKGHALYTAVAFNQQSVTSTRQGMIRISASRYAITCSFIRSKMPQTSKESLGGADVVQSHSRTEVQSHSGYSDSEFSGRSQVLSSRRSSVHIPVTSHDRSCDHSEVDTQSQHSDEVRIHTSLESTNQIEAILKDQRAQKELLEEQQQALSLLRQQQKTLEESITGTQNKQEWIAKYINPLATEKPAIREQGVNTEDDVSTGMELTLGNGTETDPKVDSETSQAETENSALIRTPSPHHTSTPSPLHASTPSHKTTDIMMTSSLPQQHGSNMTTQEAVSWRDPVANGDKTDGSGGLDLLVGQRVLARWPDDGWYYRGEVVGAVGGMRYLVMDANGDTEPILAADIITDLLDSQKPLTLGDTVVALHPDYPYSYAPGTITGTAESGRSFTVETYDGCQSLLPREELYRLSQSKHQSDVEDITERERKWMGQAVIARQDKDGLYYPGFVQEQLPQSHSFLIRWPDGSTQPQEVVHLFGQLTKRRPLRIGDKVLALAQPESGVCMPGVITGTLSGLLQVEFCDGEVDGVQPLQCFWLSPEYHQSAVELIALQASSLLSLTPASTDTSELTASYLH